MIPLEQMSASLLPCSEDPGYIFIQLYFQKNHNYMIRVPDHIVVIF